MKSICGIDCSQCQLRCDCSGCSETNGQPYGEQCMVAMYCQKGADAFTKLKEKIITALNELKIPDMEPVTDLHALKGSFINLEYPLPNGQTVKFWNDNKIYLGNQLHKAGSDRCYGVAADETHLLVSEYDAYGSNPKIIVLKRYNE